jgi:hypothetical protein
MLVGMARSKESPEEPEGVALVEHVERLQDAGAQELPEVEVGADGTEQLHQPSRGFPLRVEARGFGGGPHESVVGVGREVAPEQRPVRLAMAFG